ncbi:MAG TPA: hypothetical protein VIF64_08370 [Pyrinomonadaceae bacterium]|jgi:hypothetical protein
MQRVEKIRKRLKFSRTPTKPVRRVSLRLGGLYILPNGTELIVGVGREDRYFLYRPLVWKGSSWIVSLPIEFEIDARGCVSTGRGQPAPWQLEDLIDTGQSLERA